MGARWYEKVPATPEASKRVISSVPGLPLVESLTPLTLDASNRNCPGFASDAPAKTYVFGPKATSASPVLGAGSMAIIPFGPTHVKSSGQILVAREDVITRVAPPVCGD